VLIALAAVAGLLAWSSVPAGATLRAMTADELSSMSGGELDLHHCDILHTAQQCANSTYCHDEGTWSWKMRGRPYYTCSVGYGGCPLYSDPCNDGENVWDNSYNCGVNGDPTHYVAYMSGYDVVRDQCYNYTP